MKQIRRWLLTSSEWLFARIAWLFRSNARQHALRRLGVRLPYRYAKYLAYSGVVSFMVGDVKRHLGAHNSPIEMTIFWKGLFGGREGAELRIWQALTENVAAVFDIGANTGIYSIVASAVPERVVHAFEPVPVVYQMLQANINRNQPNRVTAHELVVSDTNGETTLYVPSDGWVDVASIEQSFAARYEDASGLREISCRTTTIDAFVAAQHLTGALLFKIDVEGAEPQVLAGMRQTLLQHDCYVLLEILNQAVFREVTDMIPTGYSLYGVTQQSPYHHVATSYTKGIKNYLIIPTEQREAVAAWIAATR